MVKVSREQSERLRGRVLDAALTELATVGHASLAVTAVASRAGVATSAVYHRFPAKDRLVRSVADERLEPMVGSRFDETITWIRGSTEPPPTRRRSSVDPTALGGWHQLLVAAAFPSGPRAAARFLLDRRLEHGESCRRTSPSSPTEADADVDASAEVLLPVAVDLGTWLVTTGLGRPLRPPKEAMVLVQAALRDLTTDADTTEWAPPRPRPRSRGPVPHHSPDTLGTALLAATSEAVRLDGFAATTVADIARRAGTSTGAVYNRFSGKGGLLAECLATDAGSTDAASAVLVECLRVAPADAEVAAVVAAVEGRALRETGASTNAGRAGGGRPARSTTAAVLVAQPLGHWILGRILGLPENQWGRAGQRLFDALARAATAAKSDEAVSEQQ